MPPRRGFLPFILASAVFSSHHSPYSSHGRIKRRPKLWLCEDNDHPAVVPQCCALQGAQRLGSASCMRHAQAHDK